MQGPRDGLSDLVDIAERGRNRFLEHPDIIRDDAKTTVEPVHDLLHGTGEIIRTLKDLEILEHTIVIFMSDNGPWYGGSTGGLKGMKATTWEGGIRVPFILHYKREFAANTRVSVPCWSPDIYPTLLALTGVEPSGENLLDGEDITEILKGNQTDHAPVFSLHNEHIMSVRKGDWKLFIRKPRGYREYDLSTWKDRRAPDGTTILARMEGQATPAQYPGLIPEDPENDIQLFNLKTDPAESQDLAAEMPEKVEELMQDYKRFSNSLTTNH